MGAVGLNEFEIVRLAQSRICRDDYFPRPLVIIDAGVIVERRAERRELDAEVAGLRSDCCNRQWRLWFGDCARFAVRRSWQRDVTSCGKRKLLRES